MLRIVLQFLRQVICGRGSPCHGLIDLPGQDRDAIVHTRGL